MTKTVTPSRFVFTVYLLHFDEPVGKAQHYLGICRSHRLAGRLREHATGNGARLTARAIKAGYGFTLAKTWQTNTASLEKKLKKQSHFSSVCPVCSSQLDSETFTKDFQHFDPDPAPPGGYGSKWPGKGHPGL